MDVTGIILAAVDCDVDVIEDWNRWYDLQHLPPNIALHGITGGRRYVAPPSLMDARAPADPLPGFAAGRGAHLTIYTLTADPAKVIAAMAEYREELERRGRMFAADKKAVRAGDAMLWNWCVADPSLGVDDCDVPHLAHTGVRVVLRRGGDEQAQAHVALAAVGVAGVHAVLGHSAIYQTGLECDIYLLEGDPAELTEALRVAAPYDGGADVVLDAPFRLIVPFDYSFADEIRASGMPTTVA